MFLTYVCLNFRICPYIRSVFTFSSEISQRTFIVMPCNGLIATAMITRIATNIFDANIERKLKKI